MKEFVKIAIIDSDSKVLEHFFVRVQEWGLPSGAVEDNESSVQAAARELLERTGFSIDPNKLSFITTQEREDSKFHIFAAPRSATQKVAEPGEKGGYSTKIRWTARKDS